MKFLSVLLIALFLASCGGGNGPRSTIPAIEKPIPYEALVRQMKYDVGTYLNSQQNVVPQPDGKKLACKGQVEFELEKVKLNVTASRATESEPSAGLEVAVGPVEIEASGSRASNTKYSIATTLVMYPSDGKIGKLKQPDGWIEGTPLSDAMNALKRDLVATSDVKPCFNFGESPEGNTVTLGFGIDRVQSAGGKLKLFFFSIGASQKDTSSIANSIEITFKPSGEVLAVQPQ